MVFLVGHTVAMVTYCVTKINVVNLLIGAIDMMKGTWQRVQPPTGSYSQGNHPEVISSHGTRSCNAGCGHYGR